MSGIERSSRYAIGSELEATFALQLMSAGIKYRQEYRAIPTRRYKWDFAIEPIEETRLLVEINGGTYRHMGHSTGVGIQRDYAKANAAVCHGFRQLTFTAQDVHDLTALDTVCKMLLGMDTLNDHTAIVNTHSECHTKPREAARQAQRLNRRLLSKNQKIMRTNVPGGFLL